MLNFWLGAIFTAVVAAIVVPLVNHHLAKKRERRFGIRVTYCANPFVIPNFLKEELRQLRRATETTDSAKNELFSSLFFTSCYIRIDLHNPSDRKLSGVTVYVAKNFGLSESVYQVDDRPELLVLKQNSIEVGSILPHHTASVRIWQALDMSRSAWPKSFIDEFNVTADEISSRQFAFPLPSYLASEYAYLPPFLRPLRGLLPKN